MKLLILFLFLSTIAFVVLVISNKNSKNLRKTNKFFKLNKKNFYKWMNFSKKERYELSKKESALYLNQRKNLLKQIRDEYKNVSNSENTLDNS
tara:strand:- start:972 stop:1250 length:279 start_codon:yes stop_codon:yes gene_type:complete